MSQCDGPWAEGQGWWEDEDALFGLTGEVLEEPIHITRPDTAGGGQTTASTRGRKQTHTGPTLAYFDPGLLDERKRQQLLLLARVKAVQDGDERFLRRALLPEAEAALQTALETALAAEPRAEPLDEAPPVSNPRELRDLYQASFGPETWSEQDGQYWQHALALWETIEKYELEKHGNAHPRLLNIWTDGSLFKGQTEGAHAGYGVVVPATAADGERLNPDEAATECLGRLRGLQEINKAELQAAIVADVLAPNGMRLHTDSQNVCTWYQKFVRNAHQQHARDYVRHPCNAELYAWSRFRALMQQREHRRAVALVKVKAHSKREPLHELNDAADKAAKRAAKLEPQPPNTLTEDIFLPPAFSMPAVLTIQGPDRIVRRVEGDPRRHAAVLHAHHTHFAWENQLNAGEWLRAPVDHGAVYDQMAMGPRRVGVSQESNCFRGTHAKLVLGTVATASVRKRDAPELYSEINPGGFCALCSVRQTDNEGRPRLVAGPVETLEHVLSCPSAPAVTARAEAEAKIAEVVASELPEALKRTVPQALATSLKVTRVTDPTLTQAERQTQLWVLRGLPPAGLTDLIRETVEDEVQAGKIARKLTKAIGEQAHKTWAARCKAYADWEKECGITKMMKERRAKPPRAEPRPRETAAKPGGHRRKRRKLAIDEPVQPRERCAECHALMSRHRGGDALALSSLSCPPDDHGWVRAAEAMQVYDHTNRYAWGVGTARTRPR
eukprot:tig00020592_g11659.t1